MTLLNKKAEILATYLANGASEDWDVEKLIQDTLDLTPDEVEQIYAAIASCPKVPEALEETEPMRHFTTGAVRDSAIGKGRYDLLPFAAIHALAKHQERGAIHYGERNVDKGLPQSSLIDSAIRHLSLYVQGDAEDYHLVAALWNIAWACEQEAKRPHLIDLPERTEKSGKAI